MIPGAAENVRRNTDENAYCIYRSGKRLERVEQIVSTGDSTSSGLKGRWELCRGTPWMLS